MLDTNVLVSGLLWTGPPQQILDAAEQGRAVLVTCPSLLDELADVLARPKLAKRLALLGTTADQLFALALGQLEIINEPAIASVVTADPNDDHVLACAVVGRARYIVSGDRHLLDLESYKKILILKPADALRKLPQASPKA